MWFYALFLQYPTGLKVTPDDTPDHIWSNISFKRPPSPFRISIWSQNKISYEINWTMTCECDEKLDPVGIPRGVARPSLSGGMHEAWRDPFVKWHACTRVVFMSRCFGDG
jgi:hypothetical protein